MREILFRGQKIRSGEWIEGYYFARPILERHFILTGEEQWEIIPETLCQYTGLTDKNGDKIWENDVVSHYSYVKGKEYKRNEAVKYIRGEFTTNNYDSLFFNSRRDYVIVIGNIFDNPELMEGE